MSQKRRRHWTLNGFRAINTWTSPHMSQKRREQYGLLCGKVYFVYCYVSCRFFSSVGALTETRPGLTFDVKYYFILGLSSDMIQINLRIFERIVLRTWLRVMGTGSFRKMKQKKIGYELVQAYRPNLSAMNAARNCYAYLLERHTYITYLVSHWPPWTSRRGWDNPFFFIRALG